MSFFASLPLTPYTATKADKEVIPEGLPDSNPAFMGDVAGVEANHSSLVRSLPTVGVTDSDAEAAQWNDDEDKSPQAGYLDPGGYDPNISGPHGTEPVVDARAGQMNGFEENADYMRWAFDTGPMPESRLCYGASTGMAPPLHSYERDQDMVLPPMHDFTPETAFEFGNDSVSPQGSFEHSGSTVAGIPVFPVVRRS